MKTEAWWESVLAAICMVLLFVALYVLAVMFEASQASGDLCARPAAAQMYYCKEK